MTRLLLALVAGEALLMVGLWLAWIPLPFVIAGVQLVVFALLSDSTEDGDT